LNQCLNDTFEKNISAKERQQKNKKI